MTASSVIDVFDNKSEYMLASWKMQTKPSWADQFKNTFGLYLFPTHWYVWSFSPFSQTVIHKSLEVCQKQVTVRTMWKESVEEEEYFFCRSVLAESVSSDVGTELKWNFLTLKSHDLLCTIGCRFDLGCQRLTQI